MSFFFISLVCLPGIFKNCQLISSPINRFILFHILSRLMTQTQPIYICTWSSYIILPFILAMMCHYSLASNHQRRWWNENSSSEKDTATPTPAGRKCKNFYHFPKNMNPQHNQNSTRQTCFQANFPFLSALRFPSLSLPLKLSHNNK